MKKYKKIVFLILMLFASLFIKTKVFATVPTWEYLPVGVNYLDPDNFVISGDIPYLHADSVNAFKIKPATTYTMYSSSYQQLFFDGYQFTFYDINKNEIIIDVTYSEKMEDGYVYSITFESPSEASYVAINFDMYLFDQVIFTYIDEQFVFYEGEQTISHVKYEGPNVDVIPVISGEVGYYYTDVDNPITVEEIKLGLRAYDDVDGDITSNIVIHQDNYTANNNVLGEHSVIFRVTDSSSNSTDFTVYVVVVDNTAPVISGENYYIVSPTELSTISYFQTNLTAIDNYDGDITSNITMENDNYTVNYNVIGTYTITFSVVDSSGNKSIYNITISVEDNISPEIMGPSNIVKSNKSDMSLASIIDQCSATDDFDGDLTSKIIVVSDEYSIHPNRVGIWLITISVTDNSGNQTTKIITIEVNDETGPIFLIDKRIITIDLTVNTLEVTDMINLLQKTNSITEGKVVEVVVDEYTENKNTPGIYKIVLEAEEEQMELEVRVIEGLYDKLKEDIPKSNLLSKVVTFIEKIFTAIKNFFKSLFVNIFY